MARFNDGDVVLVLARAFGPVGPDGKATLRIITAGSAGGPGFTQVVLPARAVYCRIGEDPSEAELVPLHSWKVFDDDAD